MSMWMGSTCVVTGGGEFKNVAILVSIAVNEDGYCEVLGAAEGKKAAREKAKDVVEELRSMKLKEAAKKVEEGFKQTLTYCDFPSQHWTRIRTNNVIERLKQEIRRRTGVIGTFPSADAYTKLVQLTSWSTRKISSPPERISANKFVQAMLRPAA